MLVLQQDGKLFLSMTLFQTFGSERLIHIFLNIQRVLTNTFLVVFTMIVFAFCAFPKQPDIEKCRFCSSDIYQVVVRTAALGNLSDGLWSLLSVVAE